MEGTTICKMVGMEVSRAKCMFCPYGHMTECHYPNTCDSDACTHYDDEYDGYEDYEGYLVSAESLL